MPEWHFLTSNKIGCRIEQCSAAEITMASDHGCVDGTGRIVVRVLGDLHVNGQFIREPESLTAPSLQRVS